jgi:hypothetical protein
MQGATLIQAEISHLPLLVEPYTKTPFRLETRDFYFSGVIW